MDNEEHNGMRKLERDGDKTSKLKGNIALKDKERDLIKQETEEFLKNGGKISESHY